MSATDAYVQILPDNSGKKVATQEITRSDGTTVVEVQEVLGKALVSDTPPNALNIGDLVSLSLTNDGRLRVSTLPAMLDVPMFEAAEQAMWGDYAATVAQASSPWAGW